MSFNDLKYDRKRLKIAVIGAGLGGSSCSYFLTSLFHNCVEIDVFEKSSVVGGRIAASFEHDGGRVYEAGRSTMHPGDLYMDELRKICGLKKIRTKSDDIVNRILDLIRRFSFLQMIKLCKWLYKKLKDMDRVYKLQDYGYVFSSVEELLHKASPSLFNISQHNIRSVLKKEKFDSRIYTDLASMACLREYNQDKSVNGYVGTIAIAKFMYRGWLWSIKNGNRQLAERLLKLCGANLHLNSKVKYIGANGDAKNVLKYEREGVEYERVYDYIILAFPLTKSNELEIGFTYDHHLECDMKVNKCYFVSSTDSEMCTSSSVEMMESSGNRRLYKCILSNDALSTLFENYEIVKEFESPLYPDYKIIEDTIEAADKKTQQRKPKQRGTATEVPIEKTEPDEKQPPPPPALFPPIQIDSCIFNLNAIDWLASSNEMSCISARNIALLISHREQTKETSMKYNKIFSTNKRDYYNDACGILSALSIFTLVFALWFKEAKKRK